MVTTLEQNENYSKIHSTKLFQNVLLKPVPAGHEMGHHTMKTEDNLI